MGPLLPDLCSVQQSARRPRKVELWQNNKAWLSTEESPESPQLSFDAWLVLGKVSQSSNALSHGLST